MSLVLVKLCRESGSPCWWLCFLQREDLAVLPLVVPGDHPPVDPATPTLRYQPLHRSLVLFQLLLHPNLTRQEHYVPACKIKTLLWLDKKTTYPPTKLKPRSDWAGTLLTRLQDKNPALDRNINTCLEDKNLTLIGQKHCVPSYKVKTSLWLDRNTMYPPTRIKTSSDWTGTPRTHLQNKSLTVIGQEDYIPAYRIKAKLWLDRKTMYLLTTKNLTLIGQEHYVTYKIKASLWLDRNTMYMSTR